MSEEDNKMFPIQTIMGNLADPQDVILKVLVRDKDTLSDSQKEKLDKLMKEFSYEFFKKSSVEFFEKLNSSSYREIIELYKNNTSEEELNKFWEDHYHNIAVKMKEKCDRLKLIIKILIIGIMIGVGVVIWKMI